MGKAAELTPKKRSVIVALAKEKLSYSAIARRVAARQTFLTDPPVQIIDNCKIKKNVKNVFLQPMLFWRGE